MVWLGYGVHGNEPSSAEAAVATAYLLAAAIFLVPFGIDRLRKMDLRIVALDIAPQDTITKDNVSVRVNAVLYFRVMEPEKAIIEVENYSYAMSQLAQTTIRSVCGQAELDELLAESADAGEESVTGPSGDDPGFDLAEDVPADLEAKAREGAEACPESAIIVLDD